MRQTPAFQKQLEDYVAWLSRLTPRSVRLIEKLASSDMHLSGPGYDTRGIDGVEAVFQSLFTQDAATRIDVTDTAWGRDGYTAYIRWTRTAGGRIDGVSEVLFGPDGMVVQQRDYWAAPAKKKKLLPFL